MLPGNSGNSQLSFIGLATIAISTVIKQYPEANFRGGIGTVAGGGSTTNPHEINQWVFQFGDGKTGNSIRIHTEGEWGNFGPPQYHANDPAGGYPVPWPITMDITEAAQILQNAGYNQAFNAVDMYWPVIEPTCTQPYYIFSFPGGLPVGVGVVNKAIRVF